MIPAPRRATREEIPVLDLSKADKAGGMRILAEEIRGAAVGLGFFYIDNHGITKEKIDEVFSTARRYFDVPLADRLKYPLDVHSRRGYMQMFTAQAGEYAPDRHESFDMGLELPLDDSDVLAGRFLHGPNRWPDEQPWLKEVMAGYLDQIMDVSELLLRGFALSLDIEEGFFLRRFRKPMMHTRMFHYPPQPVSSADDEFGVNPHADLGLITILNQDAVGGLEVRTRSGEWIGAPYIEGTFVVNLGDLFRRWTNDLYVSNVHRVINRSQTERYSIPTFVNLDYDTLVECIPSCLGALAKPKYPPILSGHFIEEGLRRDEAKAEVVG